jgi:hypothetical protein
MGRSNRKSRKCKKLNRKNTKRNGLKLRNTKRNGLNRLNTKRNWLKRRNTMRKRMKGGASPDNGDKDNGDEPQFKSGWTMYQVRPNQLAPVNLTEDPPEKDPISGVWVYTGKTDQGTVIRKYKKIGNHLMVDASQTPFNR